MTSTFERFSGIGERAKAWVECKDCLGDGTCTHSEGTTAQYSDTCPSCSGKGGAWHEAVYHPEHCITGKITGHYLNFKCSSENRVTKSSILVREWEACSECKGHKEILWRFNKSIKFKSGKVGVMPNQSELRPCEHCYRDTDGNPTGAEPGTAGEWGVEG